jgi:hypothetical protein
MPALASYDGQPLRASPKIPRGGLNPLSARDKPVPKAADEFASFETVFKAPMFNPPGLLDENGDPIADCEPELDLDFAPQESVTWLRAMLDDVADTFDVASESGYAISVPGMAGIFSGTSMVGSGKEVTTVSGAGNLTPRRKGLFGYLIPGTAEHQAHQEEVARNTPREYSPGKFASEPLKVAPTTPAYGLAGASGEIRTQESVGKYLHRMQVARDTEQQRSVSKALSGWSYQNPTQSSTLRKANLVMHASTTLDNHWERGALRKPLRARMGESLDEHVDRVRHAIETAESTQRDRLPGFQKKKLGQVMGTYAYQKPTERAEDAERRRQEAVRWAHLLAEEEKRGLPLPGFKLPEYVDKKNTSALRPKGPTSPLTPSREVKRVTSLEERVLKGTSHATGEVSPSLEETLFRAMEGALLTNTEAPVPRPKSMTSTSLTASLLSDFATIPE